MKLDADFIVAGSGAGGCAVAARLAAAGAKTLLLEQGGPAEPCADARQAVARLYTHAGFWAAAGNALIPVPTGEAVGGTTTINSGTCMRPPRAIVDGWQSAPGFSAEEFHRGVEEAWQALRAKPVPEAKAGASTRLFFAGLRRLGIAGAHFLDRAEEGCAGAGRCCFVCPGKAKVTADKAFLEPLSGNPALSLLTRTRLLSVEPAPRRGAPAQVLVEGPQGRRRLSCRAAVLACGSLATPYFLRRLGLPAGDSLSLHPAAEIMAVFDEPVRAWEGVPQAGGLDDPDEPRLRYESAFVPPELAAVTLPLEGRQLKWWMDRYDRVASFGFMVRDSSRGSIRYPFGRRWPLIRYCVDAEDAARMVRGMRFIGRALFAAGARQVLLPINRKPNAFASARELESADLSGVRPGRLHAMAFHPLGTCGLGRCVDGDLRAAEGVYACDGSVVPESLGANPQITIYAFALRLARRLLKELGETP